jgi:hypothetical protein
MELHKIRKQINEYVLLNSKTIKLHMKYENSERSDATPFLTNKISLNIL